MSISDLKVEAWERGWAAPDDAGKSELLSYLRVGSMCISRVKQIAREELLSMDPALAEGSETTAADIFRLNGLAFIDMEELYRASVFVSKSFEDQCQRELRRRCKKVHPALFKAVTSNPRLRLTYKMWKRFELDPFASVMSGPGATWPTLQPSSLDKKDGNVDVLLEISFGGKVRTRREQHRFRWLIYHGNLSERQVKHHCVLLHLPASRNPEITCASGMAAAARDPGARRSRVRGRYHNVRQA